MQLKPYNLYYTFYNFQTKSHQFTLVLTTETVILICDFNIPIIFIITNDGAEEGYE